MKPVFAPRPEPKGPVALSFLELAELTVVAKFRRGSGHRIPLWRLRDAHLFARQRLGLDYPFASGKLKVEGGHIMHEFEGEHPGPGKLAIDIGGAFVLPIEFNDALDMFDFAADGTAVKWYPIGKDRPVVIDPEHAAGQMTILGRNVRVTVIRERWDAGWEIPDIADDFSLSAREVEAALKATAA
jgi:uncharacterized protein (DUF433 family)